MKLKSCTPMTPAKARRQFRLALEMVVAGERDLAQDQHILGDECRELRVAYGLGRNAVAQMLSMDSMQMADLERRCTSSQARCYRAAVLNLARTGGVR